MYLSNYNECSPVEKRWYSILQLHGKGISDEELLEYRIY